MYASVEHTQVYSRLTFKVEPVISISVSKPQKYSTAQNSEYYCKTKHCNYKIAFPKQFLPCFLSIVI